MGDKGNSCGMFQSSQQVCAVSNNNNNGSKICNSSDDFNCLFFAAMNLSGAGRILSRRRGTVGAEEHAKIQR